MSCCNYFSRKIKLLLTNNNFSNEKKCDNEVNNNQEKNDYEIKV